MLAAMDRAAETYRSLGAIVEEVRLPRLELFGAVCIVAMTAEAFAIHERTLRERPLDSGRIFYQRVVPGMALIASDLTQAFRLRRELALALERDIFSHYGAILTCGAAIRAPRLDEFSESGPPPSFPAASSTFLAAATGHPSLALPIGLTKNGMPLGMQLVGRAFNEATLFSVAAGFESATNVIKSWPATGGRSDVPGPGVAR